MRLDETMMRELELPALTELWEMVRGWAERLLTPERKAEVPLTAGTLVLMGYLAFVVGQSL